MRKDTIYRIVVRSELNGRYAVAFEGMQMDAKGGYTVLTGKIIDQPHLYGILQRINGLGLELLSIEAMPDAVLTGPKSKRQEEDPEL
jgi:hypothetical protein